MSQRIVKKLIPIVITSITGLVVLVGYLFPDASLPYKGQPTALNHILIDWAIIVAAFALLLGLFNLARVHGGHVRHMRSGAIYSLVLLIAMVAAFIPSFASIEALDQVVIQYVLSPLGAALASLLAFTLALAAFRMLRERRDRLFFGWAFIITVVITLLGTTPPTILPINLAGLKDAITTGPGMAGMRGLLLGVAIGTVITALRVLAGSERPQSES